MSFPAASQTDFDFTRRLVETPGVCPDDVWLQVLAPCREDIIRRTVDSLKGAKKAILHIYLATSECFRRIVFNMTKEQSLEMAVRCTKYARSITKDDPSNAGTEWHFEFSPETFSDTEPEFAAETCQAVKAAWEPTEDAPMIFNLPATVEMATPNIFADQIEFFCSRMTEREKFVISVHPHNDRGCAVAAAELAQMAGAQRVEGYSVRKRRKNRECRLGYSGAQSLYPGCHPQCRFLGPQLRHQARRGEQQNSGQRAVAIWRSARRLRVQW